MLMFYENLLDVTPSVESTLSLSRTDIQTDIGEYLNFGSTLTVDTTELSMINSAMKSGLRNFYFPMIVLGKEGAHEWSFIRPNMTLVTVSGQDIYQLPSDFGGIEGNMTFAQSEGWFDVEQRGEAFIRSQQQLDTGGSRPLYFAIRTMASDGSYGQRSQMAFWPTPAAIYNLTFRYNVLPNALTSANPYPLGGMMHAETILQSCRASAEHKYKDEVGKEQALYIEKLRGSISMDQKTKASHSLGLNLDRSDVRRLGRHGRHNDLILPSVTLNGVTLQ